MLHEEVVKELKARIDRTLDDLRKDLSRIRTGRASLALLDGIRVDYYGTATPLSGVASLSVPEPRLITIKPWDRSQLKEIEKAITEANIGINPMNDGEIIRLPIPPLTEERRKDIAKQVRHKGEDHKVAVRNERRDANEKLKELLKKKSISEDDLKRATEKVQKETDQGVEGKRGPGGLDPCRPPGALDRFEQPLTWCSVEKQARARGIIAGLLDSNHRSRVNALGPGGQAEQVCRHRPHRRFVTHENHALALLLTQEGLDRSHRHFGNQAAVRMEQALVLEDVREDLRGLHRPNQGAGEHQVYFTHVLGERREMRDERLPALHRQRPGFIAQTFGHLGVGVSMSHQEDLQASSPTGLPALFVYEGVAPGQR